MQEAPVGRTRSQLTVSTGLAGVRASPVPYIQYPDTFGDAQPRPPSAGTSICPVPQPGSESDVTISETQICKKISQQPKRQSLTRLFGRCTALHPIPPSSQPTLQPWSSLPRPPRISDLPSAATICSLAAAQAALF